MLYEYNATPFPLRIFWIYVIYDHLRPPKTAQDGGRLTNVSHGNDLGRHGIVVKYHMEVAACETVGGSVGKWESCYTIYGIRLNVA